MDVVSYVIAIQKIYRGALQYNDSLRYEFHLALVNGHMLGGSIEFLARNRVDVDGNVFRRLQSRRGYLSRYVACLRGAYQKRRAEKCSYKNCSPNIVHSSAARLEVAYAGSVNPSEY